MCIEVDPFRGRSMNKRRAKDDKKKVAIVMALEGGQMNG
jgi:hypothetical protein